MLLGSLDDAATAAAATIASIASTVATAMSAVATRVAAATIAAMTTVAAATAAIAAAAAMTKSNSLAVTTDQSDSNYREKQRQTQNNNTVHPRILQITYRYRKREIPSCRPIKIPSQQPTAQRRDATWPLPPNTTFAPKRSLLSKSTGYERYGGRKG